MADNTKNITFEVDPNTLAENGKIKIITTLSEELNEDSLKVTYTINSKEYTTTISDTNQSSFFYSLPSDDAYINNQTIGIQITKVSSDNWSYNKSTKTIKITEVINSSYVKIETITPENGYSETKDGTTEIKYKLSLTNPPKVDTYVKVKIDGKEEIIKFDANTSTKEISTTVSDDIYKGDQTSKAEILGISYSENGTFSTKIEGAEKDQYELLKISSLHNKADATIKDTNTPIDVTIIRVDKDGKELNSNNVTEGEDAYYKVVAKNGGTSLSKDIGTVDIDFEPTDGKDFKLYKKNSDGTFTEFNSKLETIDFDTIFKAVTIDDYLKENNESFTIKASNIKAKEDKKFEQVNIQNITTSIADETDEADKDSVTLKLIAVDSDGNQISSSIVYEREMAYYKAILVDKDGKTIDDDGKVKVSTTSTDSASAAEYEKLDKKEVKLGEKFSIQTNNDFLKEEGETFKVKIDENSFANENNYEKVETEDITTTIEDFEDTITAHLTATESTDENGKITYTATLKDGSTTLESIGKTTVTLSNGETIIIENGKSSASITVDVNGEDVYKESETKKVKIDVVSNDNDDNNSGTFEKVVADETPVTTTIKDTETPVDLSLKATTNGADVTFTANLNQDDYIHSAKENIIVTLNKNDWDNKPIKITINKGETTGSTTVKMPYGTHSDIKVTEVTDNSFEKLDTESAKIESLIIGIVPAEVCVDVKEDDNICEEGNLFTTENISNLHVKNTNTNPNDPSIELKGKYGTLIVNSETGNYKYKLNNEAEIVQSLGDNDTVDDIFNIEILDNQGNKGSKKITVHVHGKDDEIESNKSLMTIVDDCIMINDITKAKEIDVLANDRGTSLEIVSIDGVDHGSAEIKNGKILYTPESEKSSTEIDADSGLVETKNEKPFFGTEIFTYKVKNIMGEEKTATVNVHINPDPNATTRDSIIGANGSDCIIGGKGNDYLEGNGGNDTYYFKAGDGKDTLLDNGGECDVISLGDGVKKDDLQFLLEKDGDLVIKYSNNDQITVKYQGDSNFDGIDKIKVNNCYLSDNEIGKIVQALNSFNNNSNTNDAPTYHYLNKENDSDSINVTWGSCS